MRERESGKSSSITIAQDMVKKKGEEGFLLYLKRQGEGTWMCSKCHIPSKRVNLYEGGRTTSRVLA
jgi:hypothetical protein